MASGGTGGALTGGSASESGAGGAQAPSATGGAGGAGGGVTGGADASGGTGGSAGAMSTPIDAGPAGTSLDASSGDDPCTRELLATTVDAYFAALAAGDPSSLPLAGDVKFTENGEQLEVGQGLWQNAGMALYEHSALDTVLCMSVSEAVVPEGELELPIAVRLRLEGAELTEIETIVARPGDYVIFGSPFESDPDAIIASASLGWEDPVPGAGRASRHEITAWITRYFESFPNGGCDLAEDCKRLENGGGSFACSLGASCSESGGGGFGGPLTARLVVADEVTGVGAGFTMFMGNTDMHMIMLRGGQVRAVHTILSGADGSGWDEE